MRILVLGAGGHGQVVVDILLRMADAGADLTVAGYLDDNTALKGQRPLNVPVLGRLSDRTSVPMTPSSWPWGTTTNAPGWPPSWPAKARPSPWRVIRGQ